MIRRPPRSTLDRRRQRQMCIRDRSQPLAYNKDNQEDKEPLFDAVDTVTDTLRIFADLAGGITAVSYTHLRAHETVLDLVCRLLLEKKKNMKKKKDKTKVRERILKTTDKSGQIIKESDENDMQLHQRRQHTDHRS